MQGHRSALIRPGGTTARLNTHCRMKESITAPKTTEEGKLVLDGGPSVTDVGSSYVNDEAITVNRS